MALSLRVIPGYQFDENERLTQTKLNQLGRPTIELQGALASSAIAPGSITSDKLSPSLITGLTAADPEKIDLLMFHDVSANGLRQTTIDKILALSTPSLTTISSVALSDFAWILQAGKNCQATIGDTLREAINGQTELAAVTDIDPASDTLLLFDASAAAGTNRNRKAKIGTTVRTVTRSLITDATPFSGTIDRFSDELLMNDASLPAGSQQVRIKLQDVLAQVGGIKAWARINAHLAISQVACTWVDATDTITTTAPHNLNTGDFIWFTTAAAQPPQVTAYTAYYVNRVSATTIQLYSTRQAAIDQTAAQRINLTLDTTAKPFMRWGTPSVVANPIVAGANITAFISTDPDPTHIGYYRVFFETALLTANYAVLLTGSYYDHDHDQQGLACGVNIGGASPRPPATANPTTQAFDLLVRNISGNDEAAPDILSVTVFQ